MGRKKEELKGVQVGTVTTLCEFRDSSIHGKGIFALREIKRGEILFETHVKDSEFSDFWINLKPNCLYNHSKNNANCISRTRENFKVLVADKDIQKDEELLVDYTKDKDLEQPQEDWLG